MKSIGSRFLIPLGLLAVLGAVFIFYQTYRSSRRHAETLLSRQAEIALEFNLAIRDYAAQHIRPIMENLVDKDVFVPDTMSTSYMSRKIFEEVNKRFPDYIIRFASDNPRNPKNQATPEEQRAIDYFRQHPGAKRRHEEIQIDGRRYMAIFTPKWLKLECMTCHGDPKDAPADLIKRYGPTAGFHRRAGDVAGLDTVAVPLEAVSSSLSSEFRSQSIILAAGLVILFAAIFLIFRVVVSRRLVAMAQHFDEIAAHTESPWMTPVEIKGNDEISVVGVAFNKLLEQLRGAHASLEQRVSERTEELRRANEQLKLELAERQRAEAENNRLQDQLLQSQKMEAIGNLAGGIAHDFNNILSAILGYGELASFSLDNPALAREYLEQVIKSSHRAKDLVGQILAFSRKLETTKKPLVLKLTVLEALRMLRATLPTTIEISQHLRSDSLIMGNDTQTQQIIINLATNALHAMEANGGALTVTLEDVRLKAARPAIQGELQPGDYVKLEIHDTGAGIAPEILHRIFEPYFTTKTVGKGSGLGLAIVLGIVKNLGGEIIVSSVLGQGSTFALYFPRLDTAQTGQGPKPAPLLAPAGAGRILFVDDEQILVDLGKAALTKHGYTMTATTDSREALELFRAHPEEFDLVITDLTMPKLTGVELAKQLHAIRPDVPIIVCTGYSELFKWDEISSLGVRKVLSKPLQIHRLAATVEQLLRPPALH